MKYYRLEQHKKIHTQEDIKALMAQLVFNPTEGRIKSAAEGIYGKEQGRFYVANDDERVVGILGVRRVDNTFVEIMHFIVVEDRRNQGIGHGLLECVKNYERVDYIITSCDDKMLDFYKKEKFKCKEEEDPVTFMLNYTCKLKLD